MPQVRAQHTWVARAWSYGWIEGGERERAREKESERDRGRACERLRERERERVCVCVTERVCGREREKEREREGGGGRPEESTWNFIISSGFTFNGSHTHTVVRIFCEAAPKHIVFNTKCQRPSLHSRALDHDTDIQAHRHIQARITQSL